MTTAEWKAIAEGELLIAQLLGVGGSSWAVTRATGDGVSGSVSVASVGVWSGYVMDDRPVAFGTALPLSTVGTKPYVAVGSSSTVVATPTNTTLAIGDTLTSATDGTAYSIVTQDRVDGYVRYGVTPL